MYRSPHYRSYYYWPQTPGRQAYRYVPGQRQLVGSLSTEKIEDLWRFPSGASSQAWPVDYVRCATGQVAVGDFWDIITHPADDFNAVIDGVSDAINWAVTAFGDAGEFIADHEPILKTFKSLSEGKNLIDAIKDGADAGISTFKVVGPILASIAPLIPGIGTAVGVALSMAVALANGQGISDILLSAAAGAIPGGAVAKIAFSSAAAAAGDLLKGKSIADAGLDALRAGIKSEGGDAAAAAFDAGVAIAYGKQLQDIGFGIAKDLLAGSDIGQKAISFAQQATDLAIQGKSVIDVVKNTAIDAVKQYGSKVAGDIAGNILKPAMDKYLAETPDFRTLLNPDGSVGATVETIAKRYNIPVEAARLIKAGTDSLPGGLAKSNDFYGEVVGKLTPPMSAAQVDAWLQTKNSAWFRVQKYCSKPNEPKATWQTACKSGKPVDHVPSPVPVGVPQVPNVPIRIGYGYGYGYNYWPYVGAPPPPGPAPAPAPMPTTYDQKKCAQACAEMVGIDCNKMFWLCDPSLAPDPHYLQLRAAQANIPPPSSISKLLQSAGQGDQKSKDTIAKVIALAKRNSSIGKLMLIAIQIELQNIAMRHFTALYLKTGTPEPIPNIIGL